MEGWQIVVMIFLDSGVAVPVALDWGFRLLGAALLFVIGRWILLIEPGGSSVEITVQPWGRSEDHLQVRSGLLAHIKLALENARLSIPYPQRDMRIIDETCGGSGRNGSRFGWMNSSNGSRNLAIY